MKDDPIAVIIPGEGFPGGPLLDLVTALEAHGLTPLVAAPGRGRWEGTAGSHVTAQAAIHELEPAQLDAAIVLDGPGEALSRSRALADLLRALHASGRVVCGVGHGVAALGAAGLLRDLEVAAESDATGRLLSFGAVPMREPIAGAGGILTAVEGAVSELVAQVVDFRHVSAPAP